VNLCETPVPLCGKDFDFCQTRHQLPKFLEYHILVKRKLPLQLALIALLAPWAAAQRTAHFNSPTANSRFGQTTSAFRRSSPYASTSLPFPFLTDFTPDDIYSTGYPVASQPPIILLQATRAFSAHRSHPINEPATKTQPLMIELQNGRYVRVASTPANGEALSLTNDKKPAPPSNVSAPPPAVLIFRDGHTEEVHDYAIADGTLYARGNYFTDGYWQKKIPISTLNVTETIQANTTRKVKFLLPQSPNEVITRP
jgi:hypothetical protein